MKKLLTIFCFTAVVLLSFSCKDHRNNAQVLIEEDEIVNDVDSAFVSDTSGFVILTDIIPDAILEIRYHSSFNFVGTRIDGYDEPIAIITRQAADSLKKVSDEMMEKGYRLKIYDAYRPRRAVLHFVRWAKNLEDTLTKQYFYPELDKSVLFKLGFISSRSSHSRGSTVDLTLLDMKSGTDLDMGGPFDYFGEISHRDNTKDITSEQAANRRMLRESMESHGFKSITSEWWHFTLKEEPYANTFFDFTNSRESVR